MPTRNENTETAPYDLPNDLIRYQHHLHRRLKSLTPIFAKAVIGDFSARVPIPEKEDELTEFFVGVQIILDTIREKVAEFEASVRDLQAANDIIASEKARVEAILNGIDEGLLTLDSDWRVNYINGPAVALLGDDARILSREVTQSMILEDTQGKIIPRSKHPVIKSLSASKRLSVDMTKGGPLFVRLKNDERRRVALTVTPILRGPSLAGAAVVLRDITEESNIDWAKTEIVSIASHQLRTPLTAIKWYVAALLREQSGLTPEQVDTYLRRIYEANQHMIELVDELLNVSRIDLGTLTQLPKPNPLDTALNDVLKELAVEIKNKKLTVDVDANRTLLPAFMDPNSLHIVLQNLVSNAVKYSPEGKRIRVALQQQAHNALVSIRDNGCGIPANQQYKIFTKLFRATNAATVATDGTGLGLYITKALIERAGGAIWFESAEGHGSTFYVTIPSFIGDAASKPHG